MSEKVTVHPELVASWASAALGSAGGLANAPRSVDEVAGLAPESRAGGLAGGVALSAFAGSAHGAICELHGRVRKSADALLATARHFTSTDEQGTAVITSAAREMLA